MTKDADNGADDTDEQLRVLNRIMSAIAPLVGRPNDLSNADASKRHEQKSTGSLSSIPEDGIALPIKLRCRSRSDEEPAGGRKRRRLCDRLFDRKTWALCSTVARPAAQSCVAFLVKALHGCSGQCGEVMAIQASFLAFWNVFGVCCGIDALYRFFILLLSQQPSNEPNFKKDVFLPMMHGLSAGFQSFATPTSAWINQWWADGNVHPRMSDRAWRANVLFRLKGLDQIVHQILESQKNRGLSVNAHASPAMSSPERPSLRSGNWALSDHMTETQHSGSPATSLARSSVMEEVIDVEDSEDVAVTTVPTPSLDDFLKHIALILVDAKSKGPMGESFTSQMHAALQFFGPESVSAVHTYMQGAVDLDESSQACYTCRSTEADVDDQFPVDILSSADCHDCRKDVAPFPSSWGSVEVIQRRSVDGQTVPGEQDVDGVGSAVPDPQSLGATSDSTTLVGPTPPPRSRCSWFPPDGDVEWFAKSPCFQLNPAAQEARRIAAQSCLENPPEEDARYGALLSRLKLPAALDSSMHEHSSSL